MNHAVEARPRGAALDQLTEPVRVAVPAGLAAELDVYHSWYHGFTAEYVATPNVFFDQASLQAYLANFLDPASAASTIAATPSTRSRNKRTGN